MADLRISVRELVEFLLRSGDLDNRILKSPEDAMLAGANMHRRLQSAAGDSYRAEVPLSLKWNYEPAASEPDPGAGEPGPVPDGGASSVCVTLEGRADGIYQGEDPLEGTPVIYIDEIKTTYRRLRSIGHPVPVHLAQAKCYAYIYAEQCHLGKIGVRMTYCSLLTGDIRYFHEIFDFEELSMWFTQLMEEYRPWAEFRASWPGIRNTSIQSLEFPFSYRSGQKELAAAVYRTIVLGRKLFLEAPTGTGKTITTLFPAIKALGQGKADSIFYLTARTITRTAAEDTLSILRGGQVSSPDSGGCAVTNRLRIKSVTLTAREKLCVLDRPDCNPESCPRAGGHYSRINAAMYDLLMQEDAFTRKSISSCAARHNVCPFELELDMSLYSDLIIGDYNYLFDPRASLRRFFGEKGFSCADGNQYLFLVDEAHNLLERGRDMYSASLVREDVLSLQRQVKGIWPKLSHKLELCAGELLKIRRRMGAAPSGRPAAQISHASEQTSSAAAAGYPRLLQTEVLPFSPADGIPKEDLRPAPGTNWAVMTEIDALSSAAEDVCTELITILSRESIAQQSGAIRSDPLREPKRAVRDRLLEFYYELDHFLSMLAELDDHYVIYAQLMSGRNIMVKLFCTDPSRRLAECMNRGRASILFSATLLPITYYKALLGGTDEDYEIYAQSVFDPARRGVFLVRDLSSRYRERTPDNYDRIAACIHNIIRERHGNYLIFFPSYAFMDEIAGRLVTQFHIKEDISFRDTDREAAPDSSPDTRSGSGLRTPSDDPLAYDAAKENTAVLMRQHSGMSEPERESYLARFEEVRDDRSLLGLCVTGGIFSEGIDLRRDRLIGVLIVGTGLPQVNAEREILREYFDRTQDRGYDYAYRCPGMNKVLQAAGRVIRTKEDVGIVVLIDERFALPSSQRLFPREWRDVVITDSHEIGHMVERFWNEWL